MLINWRFDMSDQNIRDGQFHGKEIADRQTTQLIGMAQGMIADGKLVDAEIHFLHKWLVANESVRSNPLISILIARIDEILADGIIDEDERESLRETMTSLTAADFELGEIAKSTDLPVCDPAPEIHFDNTRFCFTGTFTFGKRKDCEGAVAELGANAGSLTKKTDFLVIGEYATASWKQEAFGRKIEKAVEMRENGDPIFIITEAHWRNAVSQA
ncbi:NAD-dependent DNA ligase [Marinosulfonomonas sp. PRT-SC04]|nr:NAD-dependent DNA ligase [Marinosulfonomonas sp. PRT-SC04]